MSHDEKLEKDAQDVFITQIAVNDTTLLVKNELGERFAMDLETGKVTAVVKTSPRTSIAEEASAQK